jgi:hypothetical protein
MDGNEAQPNTIITTVLTFPPPKPIDVNEGDLKNKIDCFEKQWSSYVIASKIHNDEQVAILMIA